MHTAHSFINFAVGVFDACQTIWRWWVFKSTAGTSRSSKQGKVLINYGRKMAKPPVSGKFMTFVKKIRYSLDSFCSIPIALRH
jgi:hypothetical protein